MPTTLEGFAAWPLATGLLFPLGRLLATMVISLVLAQALETFGWTRHIAKLAAPLIRLARLSPLSGAAFSLSFASPAAANAMLAEGVAMGRLSRKELFLANVFNSTPAFLVHLPTLLAMAYSFLRAHALVYIGLVFAAAMLRTAGAVAVARWSLESGPAAAPANAVTGKAGTLRAMLTRLKKRLTKICLFTIPIYCLIFLCQQAGLFIRLEAFFADHVSGLFFLHPGSLGVVALYLVAESNAAFAAAAALMHGGTLTPDQAILALLAGNILSSPMRALRHQIPSYAGYFSPSLALALVAVNQSLRAATLALAAFGFYLATAHGS